MYTIVDIETTGGSSRNDKITEIAIFVHDGEKIIDQFVSLINPERSIPYFITSLTGISNEMVADAPKFYEVARKIVEITEGKTFVAHNVSFDYHFIRQEFKNLGYSFKRDLLCTVKLSRKLIPGLRSYSLGSLCNDVNINIDNRHRARGDAEATVKLFELLLTLDDGSGSIINKPGLSRLNPALDPEIIASLPEEPGIYYFYDEKKGVYICFSIEKNSNCEMPLTCFSTVEKARKHMEKLLEKHKLCQKLTGFYESRGACFHQQIGLCQGACTGKEPPAEYNSRAMKALESFSYMHENFFIIDSGRNEDERAVVKIENGKFCGYGYLEIQDISFGLDTFHDCIIPHQDNRDIQQIIKGFLKKNRVEKILAY